MNVQELTNEELQAWMDQAYEDCRKAAEEQPESEWHQACFAGLMTFVFEAQRRGYPTKH